MPSATLTVPELIYSASLVQPKVIDRSEHQGIEIMTLKITDMIGTKTKIFSATIKGWEDRKPQPIIYNTVIAFYNIDYSDKANSIPKLSMNPCRVRCDCKSFYFYFSWYDFVENCLYGRRAKPYIRKTHPGDPNYKPPVNDLGVPGVCKHLVYFTKWLRNAGYVEA